MIEQTYFLDMIPGESTPPVVHVSQFDVNSRTLTFNLMKGGVAYVPDADMSVTLDGMKPDNTVFSYPMTVDGSSVSIDVMTQMTVVSGHVRCEVSVSNQTGKIGSANFILAVEESPIDSGSISESDIPIFEDLKNQAQQAAASAEQSASDAEDFATDAETAATSVSAILPASAGTTGQVLTKTATGAEWADKYPSSGTTGQVLTKTATGEAWEDVDGLPAGGTTGQVLTKNSSTDGDASWQTPQSGGGTWGSITGTLSDQTDLQTALDNAGQVSTVNGLSPDASKNVQVDVELTQAQYDALPATKLTNNVNYFIKDGAYRPQGSVIDSEGVMYDNTESGLTSDTVQGAIDENASAIEELNNGLIAEEFDLTSSYSGVTGNGTYNSITKEVHIMVVGSTTSNIPMNTTLCTIPEKYRPKAQKKGGMLYSNDSNQIGAYNMIYANENGTITQGASASVRRILAVFNYVIE